MEKRQTAIVRIKIRTGLGLIWIEALSYLWCFSSDLRKSMCILRFFGYGFVYAKPQVLIAMKNEWLVCPLSFLCLSADALQLNTLHLKYSFGQNNGAQRRSWRQILLSNSTPVAYIKTGPFCVIMFKIDYNCVSSHLYSAVWFFFLRMNQKVERDSNELHLEHMICQSAATSEQLIWMWASTINLIQ